MKIISVMLSYQKEYAEKLKIPVLLPIQQGVDSLLPALREMREQKQQKRK